MLEPEEWGRLDGTEAGAVWRYYDPMNVRVLAVEDDEGHLVGTWSALRVVHAECAWIEPASRGKFGVAARLLRGMRDVAAGWGADRVLTASTTPEVTSLIGRLGGSKLLGEHYVIPTGGR